MATLVSELLYPCYLLYFALCYGLSVHLSVWNIGVLWPKWIKLVLVMVYEGQRTEQLVWIHPQKSRPVPGVNASDSVQTNLATSLALMLKIVNETGM